MTNPAFKHTATSGYPHLTVDSYAQSAQGNTNDPQDCQHPLTDNSSFINHDHDATVLNKTIIMPALAPMTLYGRFGLNLTVPKVPSDVNHIIPSRQPDPVVSSITFPSPRTLSTCKWTKPTMPNDMLEEPIIRRTPPEILMKIFSEFYEETSYAFKVGDKTDMAFAISHVCRQWRNTAIHLCTGFWSTLAIVSSPGSIRGRTKAWAELTSMAIHRSKNKELNITFMGSDEESVAPSLAEALCVIMAHSQRLKVLDLHLPSTFVPLLSILVGRVPNLH
ncbi:hypothetical protein ARMGADRAFT_1070666 [Armillaria gallica]|uniref:Uncharacterized protein n=1 Tax=Armillaria gallica TaxID=47427 RepID=A0A2H3EXV8_ARMGA|nr:hypothetical protein ARMGADRAFT_1070666 [Armillaria gallica]